MTQCGRFLNDGCVVARTTHALAASKVSMNDTRLGLSGGKTYRRVVLQLRSQKNKNEWPSFSFRFDEEID